MQPVVVVFPGQGAQRAGMGLDFVETWDESRAVFDEASEALDLDLRAVCAGEDGRIGLTEFTQPAILTTEIAMFRALTGPLGLQAQLFAGHSLGEYTALVAAGVIPLADAVRLVAARGRLMQAAVPPGEGAMSAVIRADLDVAAVQRCLEGLTVDVANHNAPDQVVISGAAADVATAGERIKADPGCAGARVRGLDVSAPFHSRLMATIEPEFRALLEDSAPRWTASGAAAVACNFTGGFHRGEAGAVVDALTRQISGGVRWVDNMGALIAASPSRFLEVGPNRPLRGFFRALGAEVDAVWNLVTARRVMEPAES